eukprot:7002554-Prymnesium_polylepis.1
MHAPTAREAQRMPTRRVKRNGCPNGACRVRDAGKVRQRGRARLCRVGGAAAWPPRAVDVLTLDEALALVTRLLGTLGAGQVDERQLADVDLLGVFEARARLNF